MKTIPVSLKDRSYTICVGDRILEKAFRKIKPDVSRVAILIADRDLKVHTKRTTTALRKVGWKVTTIPVPANEKVKDLAAIEPIYAKMLKAGADRHSILVALGGGAIGDAAGYVAATYMRGIRWIGVPTTLLGQVDSSIGGKTAVNHPVGKNLIGAFHQPSIVICDTSFLKTLPKREILSGFGEILKYGLIYDPKLFDFCTRHTNQILKLQPKAITRVVARSAELKSVVVKKDERDLKGVREVLNFGHTLGHAIESIMGYGKMRHGEAVLWGMRLATSISVVRGKCSEKTFKEVEDFVSLLPLPKLPKDLSFAQIKGKLKFDKKSRGGKVRFVLLKRIGKTVLDSGVTDRDIKNAFDRIGVHLK